MSWIKDKLKRAWKWIVGLFVVGAIASTAIVNYPVSQPYICDVHSAKEVSVKNILLDKSAEDRANIKGCELAKIGALSRQNIKFSGIGYDVEIISTSVIDKGVEIYARAWDKNGRKVGFGNDGTVEIERFRFFNPPIMVADGTKRIITITTDEGTRDVEMPNFIENPQLALLQELTHTISIVGKDDTKIIPGKIGKTTDTYFPDANPETTSVDGRVTNSGAVWATVRSATNGTAFDDSSSPDGPTAELVGATYYIRRVFFLFDTSSLPDTDTISSLTFSVAANEKDTTQAQDVDIVSSTPASSTSIATDDFEQVGSTVFGSLAIGSFNIDGSTYNNITLDANGIAAINKTGVSKFAARGSLDTDNSTPTAVSYVQFIMADNAGTSADPKLVVVHTAAAVAPKKQSEIWYD